MDIQSIPNLLNKKFNLDFDFYFEDDNLYLKMTGLDSRSLTDYIKDEYDVNADVPKTKCVSRIKVNNNYIKISEKK